MLWGCAFRDQPLARYNVDTSKTAVAGFSSGAFMAVQLQVAYSTIFHAAAIYAGGPFYCAGGTFDGAMACASGSADLAKLEATAQRWAAGAGIDPLGHLRGQTAYLWSGTRDRIVEQSVMDQLREFYRHYGVATAYDRSYPAGHGWESPYGKSACGTTRFPFTIDCDGYDSERTWLERFFGPLHPKNGGSLKGRLMPFDQSEFATDAAALDRRGWLFVPEDCAVGKRCVLVVALHGCLQAQGLTGAGFARETGIDQWADTNAVIVLYPSVAITRTNPGGCWDWWGYSGANYARRSGPQMKALVAMVERIEGAGARAALHNGAIAEPARRQKHSHLCAGPCVERTTPASEPSFLGVR